MSPHELLVLNLVRTALIVIIVGMIMRRRANLCWSFFVLMMIAVVGNALSTFWPDQFQTRPFYIMKSTVYNIAKLCVAAELTYRVFQSFPGALARARLILAPLMAIVAIGVISVPTGTDYHDIVTRYNPQVQTGVIWLLSATAVLTVWFNIPLHFFHRAILLGFSSYLIVFATLLNVLRSFGFDKMIDTINVIDAYAYLALVTWWAFNAWRKDHAFEVAPIRQPRLATGAA